MRRSTCYACAAALALAAALVSSPALALDSGAPAVPVGQVRVERMLALEEQLLARIKDPTLYVVGTNALFQDNLPIHAEIRATTQRANLKYPATYLAEGFIAGLVAESVLKATAWPPTPAKLVAAMNNLKVDLKGLRGGPL